MLLAAGDIPSTYSDRPLEDLLRITEVMYHPADPTPAEATAGRKTR